MLSIDRIGGAGGRAIPALVLSALVVVACAGAAGLAPAAAPGATGAAAGLGSEQAGGNGGDDESRQYALGQTDLLIIKTGSLALQVTGIDSALAAASQHISSLGGYASGSERFGEDESEQASITYRIPAARWDDALTALRGLATKIIEERTSTEDVTDQVVDLGARIKNLQTTETALQSIMDRATEIKDVLAVQAELTRVRGEIEQLTAQRDNLVARAAFSTLTVTFALKPNPVLAESQGFDPASEVDAASASLVGILQGLATAGIWFGIVWLPILLVIALVTALGVFIFRRVRRPGDETPMAAPEAGA